MKMENKLFIAILLVTTTFTVCQAGHYLNTRNTDFTEYKSSGVPYSSSVSYNAWGMAPFYNITNRIIEMFVDDQPIPDGYLIVSEQNVVPGPNVKNNEWGELLKKYWAILLVVTICALLIVLMPLIAFCFCCCRCAGACGGRSQPFDKKHDTCRRIVLGLFLICSASAMIFGVIIAFVSNTYMQYGVENITTSARYGIDDTKLYLDTTSSQIDHVLNENYAELSKNLDTLLGEASKKIINVLDEKSKAVSLTRLNDFVQALPNISRDLGEMKNITNELRVKASQLSDGLRSVKRDLLKVLTTCKTSQCKKILDDYQIGKLDVNGIDYNQLPDVTGIIDDVQALIEDGQLIKAMSDGQAKFDIIKDDISKSISKNIPDIRAALNKTGVEISKVSKQLTGQLQRTSAITGNNSYKHFEKADYYINKYSDYRYYAGLGISIVLLLILMFIVFGLMCGICGKRPDGYGDDCCNKGAGGRFLMMGVTFIFLTFSVILLVALAHFLVGIIAHRGVCEPLRNPEDDQIFNYVDKFIDLNKILYDETSKSQFFRDRQSVFKNVPLRVSNLISSCHRNKTFYEVFQLENYYNISEIRTYFQKYKVESLIQDLIKNIQINKVTLLTPEAIEQINQLEKSKLNNFDLDKFVDNLTENITQFKLNELANRLEETAQSIPNNSDMRDSITTLRNQALHLKTYQANLVEPMTTLSKRMLLLAGNLKQQLLFDQSSFEKAIVNLLKEIKDAEKFINTNGTKIVTEMAAEFLAQFDDDFNKYFDLVIHATTTDIGRCGPISNVYNSYIVATCNRIVDPFNGFWASIVWCLILYLPTLILCVKLSTLYQKSDPYPGPLVESEYMYDAYSERDNIPLANGPRNKRRKHKDRRQQSRDRDNRRGDYYEEASPTTGGHRDVRYNDMAPKNWDGAPPRYQNPPIAPPATEYERPPPYYFPGAQTDPE